MHLPACVRQFEPIDRTASWAVQDIGRWRWIPSSISLSDSHHPFPTLKERLSVGQPTRESEMRSGVFHSTCPPPAPSHISSPRLSACLGHVSHRLPRRTADRPLSPLPPLLPPPLLQQHLCLSTPSPQRPQTRLCRPCPSACEASEHRGRNEHHDPDPKPLPPRPPLYRVPLTESRPDGKRLLTVRLQNLSQEWQVTPPMTPHCPPISAPPTMRQPTPPTSPAPPNPHNSPCTNSLLLSPHILPMPPPTAPAPLPLHCTCTP